MIDKEELLEAKKMNNVTNRSTGLQVLIGLFIAIFWLLFGAAVGVASVVGFGFIVYFFLAMAGVVPPVDFFPFVPYI
jgi:nitrate reductase NapE component